jgi:hypothetical protein
VASKADDAATRLWWAARRYLLLIGAVVATVVAVALLLAPPRADAVVYEARALVIAQDLQAIRVEQLPRMAQAIFVGSAMAERAVQEGRLPVPPRELVPFHARLEPVEGTVLLGVVGTAPEPDLAADIANAVARALSDELSRGGAGVGVFDVQEEARVPEAPTPTARFSPVVIGFIAGMVIAAGVIGLLMVLRRPILSAEEAVAVAGAPLLGAPVLPPVSAGLPDPRQVLGITALIKRIYPRHGGAAVFLSCQGDKGRRSQVAGVVAATLARSSDVTFVSSGDRWSAPIGDELGALPRVTLRDKPLPGEQPSHYPTVIDGPSTEFLDVPQFLPADSVVALVIGEGTPSGAVESAVDQFLPGELRGVVYVPGAPGRRGFRRAQPAKARWSEPPRSPGGSDASTAPAKDAVRADG